MSSCRRYLPINPEFEPTHELHSQTSTATPRLLNTGGPGSQSLVLGRSVHSFVQNGSWRSVFQSIMTRLMGNSKSSTVMKQMMRMAMKGWLVQCFAYTRQLSLHEVTSDEISSALSTVTKIQFLPKSGEINTDHPTLASSVPFGDSFFLKHP